MTVKPAADIQAAINAAAAGDTLLLAGNVYTLSSTINVTRQRLTITPVAGVRPSIQWVSPKPAAPAFFANKLGDGLSLNGLEIFSHNSNCIGLTQTSNVTLSRLRLHGYGGVMSQSVNNLVLDDCEASKVREYVLYCGGPTPCNGVSVRNLHSEGSIDQHILRFHNSNNVLVEGGVLNNPWDGIGKEGSCIGVRDGSNVVVRNVICNGSIGLGPLGFAPASVQLKTVHLSGVIMQSSYMTLESGLKDCIIEYCSLNANKSNSVIGLKSNALGKGDPEAIIRHTTATYAGGGRLFSQLLPTVTTLNVSFN